MMTSLRSRVEAWIREQTGKIGALAWSPPPMLQAPMRWPPWSRDEGKKEREKRLREEYEIRRKQLKDLCRAVKAESVADLQEILCSMVLSECVYKRPASEVIRVLNKFKADFGGHVISLERVQPSLDHVPHRYLLAETGDTLFASFIGTKQYKDIIADANILQGVIFPEETVEDLEFYESQVEEKVTQKVLPKSNGLQKKPKPAAHRGFLARAKGIPALELYKLAQKKKRKLVLCGHSLGGAVAALATLAILRVIASSSTKDQGEVQIKCITFSQPPVGNAALRDYVHHKGWEQYFKSYCIPEDLIPRILSPAYFHHYNSQSAQFPYKTEGVLKRPSAEENKEGEKEQLVMGLGPVRTSLWRLSRLVPLQGVWKQMDRFKGRRYRSDVELALVSTVEEEENGPSSLQIQEGSESVSLSPIPSVDEENGVGESRGEVAGKITSDVRSGWQRVPYLPSYVPFGKLYLLGNSSVDFLSDSEYSKLTSVRSVISELKERFQSHSMKSYRSRFQRIFDLHMSNNATTFLGGEQLAQFPHLQQLLEISVGESVELGHIVESPVIQTATSIVPLGWRGVPGEKNAEPLKIDVTGHGLHLFSLVQVQVNGNWCSTVLESLVKLPPDFLEQDTGQDFQKIRILVGPPLRRPVKHPFIDESFPNLPPPAETEIRLGDVENPNAAISGAASHPLGEFIIYCTTDFATICKQVHVRTRRVRLLGLEGSGKTALFNSIVGHGVVQADTHHQHQVHHHHHHQREGVIEEGISGGLCFIDSPGVRIQDLEAEAEKFKNVLRAGREDQSLKTDAILLIHNLSHELPHQHPAPLAAFLKAAEDEGIPCVLAVTNKFSVSAGQLRALVGSAMKAFGFPRDRTQIVNSSPYVVEYDQAAPPWALFSRKKSLAVMPVQGLPGLRRVLKRVLLPREEEALQELLKERLIAELAMISQRPADDMAAPESGGAITAAAVGASLGAGLGIVMAIVMGAGSALRKP